MTERSAELFPPSPRVVYSRAPLVQVICQLRFPSLLSIESKPPVDFQEQIRSHFPLLEKVASPVPVNLPPEVVQMIGAQGSPISYQFLTEDRASTVTLTPESVALSTSEYTRWEHFRDQLRVPLASLNGIYRPSFFSRIGLRYQNAIDRARLGLQDTPWSKLLRQEMLGELALPRFEANLEHVANRAFRVKIPDRSGSLLMRHGFGTLQGSPEICYMIDADFFSEQRTEVANATRILDHFNRMAGHAFRWYITEPLRDALGPSELPATASA
jgi:uncharacterized protein (TIGR04255 family)